jgi:hypothetical protein
MANATCVAMETFSASIARITELETQLIKATEAQQGQTEALDNICMLYSASLIFFMNPGFRLPGGRLSALQEHSAHPGKEPHRARRLFPRLVLIRLRAGFWYHSGSRQVCGQQNLLCDEGFLGRESSLQKMVFPGLLL